MATWTGPFTLASPDQLPHQSPVRSGPIRQMQSASAKTSQATDRRRFRHFGAPGELRVPSPSFFAYTRNGASWKPQPVLWGKFLCADKSRQAFTNERPVQRRALINHKHCSRQASTVLLTESSASCKHHRCRLNFVSSGNSEREMFSGLTASHRGRTLGGLYLSRPTAEKSRCGSTRSYDFTFCCC